MSKTVIVDASFRMRRRGRFIRRAFGGGALLLADPVKPLALAAVAAAAAWSVITVVGPYLFDPRVARVSVAGATAQTFSPTGGSFRLSIVPRHPGGRVAWQRISLDQFSFRRVAARAVGESAGPPVPVRVVPTALRRVPGGHLNAVLVMDNSGSMDGNDAQRLRFAAAQRFLEHLGDGDRVALTHFHNGSIRAARTFTSELTEVGAELEAWRAELDPHGGTPLYGSVVDATERFPSEPGARRVILLLTDGVSDGDSATAQRAVEAARRRDATVYAIGLGESVDRVALQDLARQTGGTFLSAGDSSGLASAFEKLALSTRQGYVEVQARGRLETTVVEEGTARLAGELVLRNAGREFNTPFDLSAAVDAQGG